MRSFAIIVLLAACLGCAGSRAARQQEERHDEQAEAIPAPQPEAGEAPAPIGEPIEVPLPPEEDATWIAPEIRSLAETLQQTDSPPTALYYVGGSIGPGCLELYTFRLFYGARDRYADVAGFADEPTARRCEQIAAEKGLPVPERLGAWFVELSDPLAADQAIAQALREEIAAFTAPGATPIPGKAVPFGAQPDTFVRRRHPPPAN